MCRPCTHNKHLHHVLFFRYSAYWIAIQKLNLITNLEIYLPQLYSLGAHNVLILEHGHDLFLIVVSSGLSTRIMLPLRLKAVLTLIIFMTNRFHLLSTYWSGLSFLIIYLQYPCRQDVHSIIVTPLLTIVLKTSLYRTLVIQASVSVICGWCTSYGLLCNFHSNLSSPRSLEASIVYRLSGLRYNYRHDNNGHRTLPRVSDAYELSDHLAVHGSNKKHLWLSSALGCNRLNMISKV